MHTEDRLVAWKTARKFFSVQDIMGIIGIAGADTAQANGAAVVAAAAGGSQIGVLQMGANADEVATLFPLPYNMARDKKVLGRVWFVHSSTDADAPVFTFKYKFHKKTATVVDVDTSEDKLITLDAHTCSTTVESLEITDWYDLEWEDYLTDDDVAVGLLLACSTISGSANEVELLGFELMWEVEAMDEVRRKTDHELLRQPT